jgi:superfamily II DNA/RNA helicase
MKFFKVSFQTSSIKDSANLRYFDMQEKYKTFSDLGLKEDLVKAYNGLNFFVPSPIQEKAIPLGLQGADLISQSKAGTGKTLAFLGILFSRLKFTEQTTQAIIVLPTRELAFQIFDMLRRVAKKLPGPAVCESACFIGGIPIDNDRIRLQNSVVHIVVGTPGRLKALIKEKLLVLDHIKMLVLDEADKLLDVAGFGDDVYHLMTKLKGKCQFLAFSATIEEKILDKLKSTMQNPSIVFLSKEEMSATEQIITTVDSTQMEEEKKLDLNITNLRQYYVRVESGAKGINLAKNLKVIEILKNVNYDQAIIFYNDKALGEDLASDLRYYYRSFVLF